VFLGRDAIKSIIYRVGNMLKHVTFIVLFALFFTSAFGHTGVCGTQHPSRLSHVGAGAKVAASSDCFSTVCDDPANRSVSKTREFLLEFKSGKLKTITKY
jgi:hypothetical protein